MNSKLNAALISGIAAGIAGNLPYLDQVCCAWMIAGGVLAAYLYFKGQEPGETKQIGTGALLGLNMGLVAALVGTIVKAILISAGTGMVGIDAELAAAQKEVTPELASLGPEAVEMWSKFTRIVSGAEGVTGSWVAITLVVWLVIYSIFGVIGGMVGAAIFAKKQ